MKERGLEIFYGYEYSKDIETPEELEALAEKWSQLVGRQMEAKKIAGGGVIVKESNHSGDSSEKSG